MVLEDFGHLEAGEEMAGDFDGRLFLHEWV